MKFNPISWILPHTSLTPFVKVSFKPTLMLPLGTYKEKFVQLAQKQIRLLSLIRNIEDLLWSERINESCSNSGTALIRTALSSLVVKRTQGAIPPLALCPPSSRQNKNKRQKIVRIFSPRAFLSFHLALGGINGYERKSNTSLFL